MFKRTVENVEKANNTKEQLTFQTKSKPIFHGIVNNNLLKL